MDSIDPARPLVESVPIPLFAKGSPSVDGLHYEPGHLVVPLHLPSDVRASVEFVRVVGFRVLDEGDLLEFWDPDTRVEVWLWRGEGEGWLAQERRRPGFVSGLGQPEYSEYLVLGENDCVSVFGHEEPKITPG